MKNISKEMKNNFFGLGLFLLIGIVFITLGAYLFISRAYTKSECDTEVNAVVVDMVSLKTPGLHKRITYAPVLEYEYNGKTYKYTSNTGTKPAKYKRGQRIKILIDSHSPEVVYLPTDDFDYILFILMILGGAVFAVIGICGFVYIYRRRE
ncbi:MAG: DUF3592 domain-containing protein [Ruminococcus sp.]|uniref:DUF3592 domain-containing protein n=1 Tax=Ruminococcus sp. TaxID=41978 RepID=UPI0025FECE79|nr:DUF3592 domain-containing protein [Ruminococcus sp.]MCR4796386.1 DUF3592 domain-containing protein [Ruminococcus sp.]